MTDTSTVESILKKLASLAVPMDEREFTNEEYNRVFPRGTVDTPIGEVKIGKNQFSKLAEKDGGSRQGLIGVMRQTLSDPGSHYQGTGRIPACRCFHKVIYRWGRYKGKSYRVGGGGY